jgi:hypothetical protein
MALLHDLPRRVQISAHRIDGSTAGTIESLDDCGGRIDLLLRLDDGSQGAATLFDDGVNSLELESGGMVFVLPPQARAH